MFYINIQLIIAIGVILAVVLICFYVRSMWLPNKKAKIIEVNSKITNKKIDEWRSSPTSPAAKDFYVTFDVGGELIEIKLSSKKQYDELSIGEEGILSYQDKRFTTVFINFRKTQI